MRVRFDLLVGQNVLGTDENGDARVAGLADGDVIWMADTTSPAGSPLGTGQFFRAAFNQDTQAWTFTGPGSPGEELQLNQLNADGGDVIRAVTVSVTVIPADPAGFPETWAALPVEPDHTQAGMPDSLSAKFAAVPNNLAQARSLPIVIELGADVENGVDVLTAIFGFNASDFSTPDEPLFAEVSLTGGNDGLRPTASEYEGVEEPGKTGLKIFEDLDDISIVAAPGSTFGYENGYRADANTIINLLISHARRMRYRIAVLDSGAGQSISQVRALRARFDSTYAALYYPWVRVLDPVTRKEINLPPSGFVAGIYARNDINRAVYKAPANEVVNLALGFEKLLNKSQQDVLNPEGINCFRFFEGRGFRLWGARTISSDPEWKYVNLRRYFAYLEHSIDKGTQWAVFEPNGEQLWGNVRRTIEDFLLNEWQMGALLGDKPEKAYFVKCDRSTMTQNDLDNGRLVCLIGLAPLRPAEFVIFRIGQWTADRKV
jgi:hypothetical protein